MDDLILQRLKLPFDSLFCNIRSLVELHDFFKIFLQNLLASVRQLSCDSFGLQVILKSQDFTLQLRHSFRQFVFHYVGKLLCLLHFLSLEVFLALEKLFEQVSMFGRP